MKIYFSSEQEKLKPYVNEFEKASTGEKVKETLLAALAYCNTLHSKRFGTEAKN